ncbi:MAG: heavy-metal-associated domain-containing protein [Clostridia bacterium]|nr:heavy-metal-associated domain-containing protein [Clostridia bacterium]
MVKITVKVDGMMCSMCENHINDVIRQKLGVKKVKSSHSSGTTEIIAESEIPVEEIKNVINETGYTFIEATSEPYKKKGLFSR